jgi:hypothetical protein
VEIELESEVQSIGQENVKEKKTKEKVKYYSLKNILKYKAVYNILIGERSNGKTYAVIDYMLKDYCENGNQCALVRRWDVDYKGKRSRTMFANHVNNGLVKKYTKGQWDTIAYMSDAWYLARYDQNLKKLILNEDVFCYGFALNNQEHDKSTSYPRIKTIFFDEIITRRLYLQDEFVICMNTFSTIIRDRGDVTIFMAGNTVNKYCPYFTEMGLTYITRMKKGTIDLYKYGDSELTVAVEFTDFPQRNKKSDKYFAFNNPKLQMITSGAWEIALYPHLPMEYKNAKIAFIYFIIFGIDTLQCEVMSYKGIYFTYIHKKTTPLKNKDKDLIFSQDYNHKPNWRRKLTKPYDELGKKIKWFFNNDKVFYQDNEVGEIVRNYINWSDTDRGIQ